MSAKYGIPVCPHAGGVGLCEYVVCSPITTTETDTEEDVDPSLADRLYLRVWKYGAERPGVCRVRFPYFFDTGVDGYQPLARTLPLPRLHQRSRSIQVSHLPLPGKAAQTDGTASPPTPKGATRSRCTKTRWRSSPSLEVHTGSQQREAKPHPLTTVPLVKRCTDRLAAARSLYRGYHACMSAIYGAP